MSGYISSWQLNNSGGRMPLRSCRAMQKSCRDKSSQTAHVICEEHLSVGNILCQVMYMTGWALYITLPHWKDKQEAEASAHTRIYVWLNMYLTSIRGINKPEDVFPSKQLLNNTINCWYFAENISAGSETAGKDRPPLCFSFKEF